MVDIRLRVCYPESSDKKATPKESVTPCQRKKRLQVVRKATVYDLQKILDKGCQCGNQTDNQSEILGRSGCDGRRR